MESKTNDKEFIKAAHMSVLEVISTGNWVQDQISEVLKPFKLSNPQFNVLRILRGQKGKPASLSCISDKMIHKMSNTTRLVDKLLEKGLVDRIICPENRRKVEITITEDGLKVLQKIDGILEDAETNLMSNLDKAELVQLQQILSKIKS
ncbi:MarR family winged helix-turn-helix transcriptional regulator [Salinimicrobium gaetbulicola]|uniref:MarR family winged helix-turn-helix transcriptional regulator n=1 Tax=Salinimicrobium gaetbulicola TaxID=999702 RepID=A0ABW3IFX2_9FLAO